MQEFNEYTVEIPQGTIVNDRVDKIASLVLLGMASSKANAWAGPEHWKYRKAKGTVWVGSPLGFYQGSIV